MQLWTTSIVHITGDAKLCVGKYYKFGPKNVFIAATHMDITQCKFKINKLKLYKIIKIKPELLTFEIYG